MFNRRAGKNADIRPDKMDEVRDGCRALVERVISTQRQQQAAIAAAIQQFQESNNAS